MFSFLQNNDEPQITIASYLRPGPGGRDDRRKTEGRERVVGSRGQTVGRGRGVVQDKGGGGEI